MRKQRMVRKTAALRTAAAVVLLAAAPGPAGASPFGQPSRDYSATSVIESGGHTMQQRVFYSPGRLRSEMPGGGAVIVLFDQQAVFMVMSGIACMQMPMQQAAQMTGAMMDESRTRRTEVGRETIDGRSTTHYTFESDLEGITSRGSTWISDDGLAVRTEGTTMVDGTAHDFRVTLRDVRFEPQEPSLFQPPSGCQQMPGGAGPMPMPRGGGLMR